MKIFAILLILLLFNLIAFSQPDELYRGRHKIGGMTYGHPYTTFDRHNGISFIETITKIRKKIIEEYPNGPVFKAYLTLVDYAEGTRPKDKGLIIYDDKGESSAPSDLAVWAKDNAFVFLIGLDRDAKWMDTTDYNGVKSNAKRDSFRDRVYMDDYPNNTPLGVGCAFVLLCKELSARYI